MTRTEEFIQKARLKLSGKKYRFFGLCLYPIRIVNKYIDNNIEGFINYEVGSKKFENQIHINEKFIDEHYEYKTTNMIDIMLHELNHILRRHDIRGVGKNSEVWNVACDHIIDKSLKNLNLSIPLIRRNIIERIEYDNDLQSEEVVYNWLMKNRDKVSISRDSGVDEDVINVSDQYYQADFQIIPDLKPHEISPEEKQVIEDYVAQVRAVYNIEKERGSIASDLVNMFDELLKVKIPWENLLDKAIKMKANEKANRRSWKRLNKYYVSLNISLPGYSTSRDKESTSTLIVHIDSSGSMDDDDLRKAGYVIYRSVQYFEKIILIIADIEIHQNIEFNKNEFNRILDYFKTEGIKGRGGTSHRIVFGFIDKYFKEHCDDLSLVISITDTESDIEYYIKTTEFIKAVPLIIVNTANKKKCNYKNVTTINTTD